ncbi:putative apoptosis inhibitory 5 [Medicago truncatula]|uniref:Putative apoptosis inhibitory 5 n=1 Tax=Medicago truncatula TaxID=3880 RepID=A0A396HYM9_MEDTR|nr:putative apoptosis inhibitory 5 [Medicago truncatula]
MAVLHVFLLKVIEGLPILFEDSHHNIENVVDIFVQILGTAESLEHLDAVVWTLMSLLGQDSRNDVIREKVMNFLRDKVFPFKAELLKPQGEMERCITDLIKKSLEYVNDIEFQIFMDS